MKSSCKLYAIMFTDIEGYTALMQKDEQLAIDIRNQHREIFDSVTHKFQGNIIQYYGDGTLSVFESAMLSVQCATQMQKRFLDESSIPVRIGIHVGDIVISENDIIGDAVNLASRVESLAVAGSVLVSNKVVEELKNHRKIKVKPLGKFHFKNDTKPREIFAIDYPGLVIPKRSMDLLFIVVLFLYWSFKEAKKYKMKNLWIAWVCTFAFGLASGLPLFLYLREKKISMKEKY